jgi:hypothetical protein
MGYSDMQVNERIHAPGSFKRAYRNNCQAVDYFGSKHFCMFLLNFHSSILCELLVLADYSYFILKKPYTYGIKK